MRIVRKGVFETNSSSTHSITMCMKSDYDKWSNGELYFFDGRLISKEEADIIKKKSVLYDKCDVDYSTRKAKYKDIEFNWDDRETALYTKENLDSITDKDIEEYEENELDIYEYPTSFDDYWNYFEERLETYTDSFKTPNGEEVVAFGTYGNDW